MPLRYINPPEESKESWLRNNGVRLDKQPTSVSFVVDFLLVCMVENGEFTAAHIIHEYRDFMRCSDPIDPRPKTWYAVKKEILAKNGYL